MLAPIGRESLCQRKLPWWKRADSAEHLRVKRLGRPVLAEGFEIPSLELSQELSAVLVEAKVAGQAVDLRAELEQPLVNPVGGILERLFELGHPQLVLLPPLIAERFGLWILGGLSEMLKIG